MDGEEVMDALNADGSAKLSSGISKHEDIKQENFDGWDAGE